MKNENRIDFTKLSGEVILSETYPTELIAQNAFDGLESIKWPQTYKGLTLNLSEYPEGRIGSVSLVVVRNNNEYIRRELYRKA